jgi:hypothetical protein
MSRTFNFFSFFVLIAIVGNGLFLPCNAVISKRSDAILTAPLSSISYWNANAYSSASYSVIKDLSSVQPQNPDVVTQSEISVSPEIHIFSENSISPEISTPEVSTIITGSQLEIASDYVQLVFNGPYIHSLQPDGNGTTLYGKEWLFSNSGYQWYLNDGTWLQEITTIGEWKNLSLDIFGGGNLAYGKGCYSLNYTLGGKINAILTITVNNWQIYMDYEFTALQNIDAVKNGWIWNFNQTTSGYSPELIDFMWGRNDGEAYQAMTMHQTKRRDFMYIWGAMDEYCYQGVGDANATLEFRVLAEQDQNHLFLNENNHLQVVTWNWNRHIGNEIWNIPIDTKLIRSFRIGIHPMKNWRENGPEEYPRFSIDTDTTIGMDPEIQWNYGDAVTRFLWERAYTYGAPSDGNWIDWGSTEFAWNNPTFLTDLIKNIENMPISNVGHVASWGPLDGWPFPDNDSDMFNTNYYDTRHSSTNPYYLTAIWRVWQWTANDTWLQKMMPTIYHVTDFMVDMILEADEVENPARVAGIRQAEGAVPIPAEAEGLVLCDWVGHHGGCGGIGSNYWDIEPFGWLDSYANALTYGALLSLADFEDCWGNASEATIYRERAEKLKIAYSKVFWDDIFGRFIGCVDAWGVKHDYGFTFINQQAAYYGIEWGNPLVNITQVYRMYDWMEKEPTSSGDIDTFSRWIYAARANTDINHRDALNRTIDKDWWVALGDGSEAGYQQVNSWTWCGNDNGQLQNGGCSVYTSYHDLMSRLYFISADDAEQRLREILDRWALPDHITGGSPLYLGEVPQQENSGSVGTDYPFPESGMVPAIMIFGLLGLNPHWMDENIGLGLGAGHVLSLSPTLPTNWDGFSANNILFAGMSINITINETHVEVQFPSLSDPTLQILLNGTRDLISNLIDGNGKVVLEYNGHVAEKEKRYNDAVAEYNDQVAAGRTKDKTNTEALNMVPDIDDPEFYPKLAQWWNESVLLLTSNEWNQINAEIQTVTQSLNIPLPMSIAGRLSYEYVILQKNEAQQSYQRGDLRWTLANYRQAMVIVDRIEQDEVQFMIVSIFQFGLLPTVFILAGLLMIPKTRRLFKRKIGGV